jgi:hypothetical protein
MTPPNSLQLAQKEGRIALAMQAYKERRISSLRTAAQTYDVPESTLRGRVNGVIARRDSVPTSRKLTTSEESTLVQWILSMDERGLAPRHDTVRQMANILLQKRSTLNHDNPPYIDKL